MSSQVPMTPLSALLQAHMEADKRALQEDWPYERNLFEILRQTRGALLR